MTPEKRTDRRETVLPSGNTPLVRLADLLRGHAELLIEHAGAVYRLRLTRNGKLILTK